MYPVNSSKPNLFRRILNSFDYFGIKPRIYIHENTKYKTTIGAIITLIIYVTITASFLFFGSELIKREKPQILKSEYYYTDPDAYRLDPDNFFFFIGLQDKDYNYYIDPSIINVQVKSMNVTRYTEKDGSVAYNFEHKILEVEPCNLKLHAYYFNESFAHQPLDNLYCIKPEYYGDIYMAGYFGESTYNYISVELEMCTNSSNSNVVCKSKEEINKILSGGFFVMDYVDTIFEPINYHTPNKFVRRDFYTTISNNYFKEIDFFFKNVDYMTDKGTILEDYETKKYLQLDRHNEIYDFRPIIGNQVFLQCVLRLSNMKNIYTRKYVKLQDVTAQVGGLVKGLFLIVKIIYINFSHIDYFFNLGDHLFFVEDPIAPNKNEILENMSKSNLSENKNKIIFSTSANHPTNQLIEVITIQPKIKRELLKFQNNKSEAKFFHKLITTLKFYCLNLKTTGKPGLFYRISQTIKQQSDIRVFLRMFHEIDNFKKVLLKSNDRMNVFEFLSTKNTLDNKIHLCEISKITDSYEKLKANSKKNRAVLEEFEKKLKI
jgi:hypothetical protein